MSVTKAANPAGIPFTIDGGGSVITTGLKYGYAAIPFACDIKTVTIVSDVSGSIVIDIWKDTYANVPPTVADTITASAKPTLSSAQKNTDSTLTGWTKRLNKGDVLYFNVDSVTTITRLDIMLNVTKV